jgi:hypothetical protein
MVPDGPNLDSWRNTEWNVSLIWPTHKESDILEYAEYSGIYLPDIVYRMFSTIMTSNLETDIEKLVREKLAVLRRKKLLSIL